MPVPADPSARRARAGVSITFFTNGLVMALLPRLPEVKQAFGLGDGGYGVMVAAMGVGALCAVHLPARWIARHGALAVALGGMLVVAVLLVVAGYAPHPLLFAAALFGIGVADAAVDAAQNTQGVIVQLWTRRTIINSLHASWSVGAAFAGLLGSAAAGLRVPLGVQNIAVAVLIIVLSLVCFRLGTVPEQVRLEQAADRARRDRNAPGSRRRLLPVLPLAVIALCGVLPEDFTNNWGAVYLVQVFDVGVATAGLGLVTMLVCQVIGRFAADPLSDRFGAFRVATAGSCLVVLGSATIMLTPHPAGVYAGFAMIGLGCASLVPTAFAAAGHVPGIAAGTGITMVSWMMRVGFASSSPLLGGISELAGLRAVLLVPIMAGVAAAGLAWARREPAGSAGSPGELTLR